jgi:hypothetical protein
MWVFDAFHSLLGHIIQIYFCLDKNRIKGFENNIVVIIFVL